MLIIITFLLVVFSFSFVCRACVLHKRMRSKQTKKKITNLCDSRVIKCRYIEQINNKKNSIEDAESIKDEWDGIFTTTKRISGNKSNSHFSIYVFFFLFFLKKKEAIDFSIVKSKNILFRAENVFYVLFLHL